MNLYQAQRHAQENAFDKEKFIAFFPAGTKECRWLDAYFGLFVIDGVGEGFVTVDQIDSSFPDLVCIPVPSEEEA